MWKIRTDLSMWLAEEHERTRGRSFSMQHHGASQADSLVQGPHSCHRRLTSWSSRRLSCGSGPA